MYKAKPKQFYLNIELDLYKSIMLAASTWVYSIDFYMGKQGNVCQITEITTHH